ncbi:class I SAM-dependent methyltransferase [Chondromyces apiculatus]|uniref:Putative methyl transferase n=1 Tax=Chondromyces apiculatus DSM 436 TaxID=1192034 RepID=A0A017SZD7_9BACT|nr:class I SAM-dependent methyltransferase [Chondromyces apiculatus]EYF02107.1 putative methyl transferase [Chondromyces apiculatus DSM 436]
MALSPKAVLGDANVYTLLQHLVGAHLARKACIEALEPRPGDHILDIGCGPAYYLDDLPACDYYGFDTDTRYIAHARRRFGHRARFFDELYTEEHRVTLPPFEGVLLMGLLHHLDDAQCNDLLALMGRSLVPGGRVVSLDTVLFDGQSRVSRFLARNDRGEFVRSPEAFRALARRHFARVESRLHGDTWRMPSAHFSMVLSEPIQAAP